jgi:hypothetical protein
MKMDNIIQCLSATKGNAMKISGLNIAYCATGKYTKSLSHSCYHQRECGVKNIHYYSPLSSNQLRFDKVLSTRSSEHKPKRISLSRMIDQLSSNVFCTATFKVILIVFKYVINNGN